MKRPLAVIGLLYFVTLAVAYHCHSAAVSAVIAVGAVSAAAGAVAYRLITHKRRSYFTVVAGSVSVLCALLALFLFQNMRVQPILDAYAGKTVRVTGYVDDKIQIKPSVVSYTLHCDTADGQPVDFAVGYTTFNGYDIESFDRLAVTLTPEKTVFDYSVSKGVYLYAFEEDGADLALTGEKHVTPYVWAVHLRKAMQHTLRRLLDTDAAGVACAVLLGNKAALPDEVYQAFLQTGTSYLIVVSGMHLAVITLLVRRLFRRIERFTAWLPFIGIVVVTVGFMAVTGFSPSVTRAGIMLLMTYFGKFVFRDSDGFTSLGVAALVLTAWNPYAVGDNGLLLSFAATFGILLWAEPICSFCVRRLRLTEVYQKSPTRRNRVVSLLKSAGRKCVAVFATSLAATLWVTPLSILLFGRITPLTVLVSVVAYPLTCAVLLLSFALLFLQFLPFVYVPVVWLCNLFAGWLVAVEQWCAALPWASVPARRLYCYIWLAVTTVLVLCGYLFRRGRLYVLTATVLSVLLLTVGSAITALTADNTPVLTVWRAGSGYTAMVRKGDRASLLSCGGTGKGKRAVTDALAEVKQLDTVIISGSFRQNASFLPLLTEENRISNLLLYDRLQREDRIHGDNAVWFHDNTRFSVALNSDVTVDVVCTGKRVYRYVHSDSLSVLFVPKKAKPAQLPEALRRVDVVISEGNEDYPEITARRTICLTDGGSGEVLHDGEVFELILIPDRK